MTGSAQSAILPLSGGELANAIERIHWTVRSPFESERE
jgi:hypothetical protein